MLRMEIALILVLGFVAYIYILRRADADGAAPHIFGAAGGAGKQLGCILPTPNVTGSWKNTP